MSTNGNFKPVKDFANEKEVTVQAVYQGIKRGKYEMKKIGSYTLVREVVA
jgi:predicted DNA-binding protein YlxM (UPF0122 family)